MYYLIYQECLNSAILGESRYKDRVSSLGYGYSRQREWPKFPGGYFRKIFGQGGIFPEVSNFDRKSRLLALLSHNKAKLTLI